MSVVTPEIRFFADCHWLMADNIILLRITPMLPYEWSNLRRLFDCKSTFETRSGPFDYWRIRLEFDGNLNQWPFAQLQEFTAYKAARNGVRILMVDPAYTSQKCNRCGYVDARNRNHARFDCLRCGHSDNADHNAALNIRDRAIQNLG